MFEVGPGLLVLIGVGGFLVLVGVGTLLFQAGCALADVPDRGYFRALPIYSATLAVCLPVAALLIWFAGRFDIDPKDWFGSVRVVAMLVSLLLFWLLSAGIYRLLLAASLRKGLQVAGIELLLMALLAALVTAVVMVILAFVQISTRSSSRLSSVAAPRSTSIPCASATRDRLRASTARA